VTEGLPEMSKKACVTGGKQENAELLLRKD